MFDLDQVLSNSRAEIEQKITIYNNKKDVNVLNVYLIILAFHVG